MEFWQATFATETDQLLEVAPIIEEVGFSGVTVSDHVFLPDHLESKYPYVPGGQPYWTGDTEWPDAWVTISAMAAVTQRLRFATYVYILPARHPFTVAKAVGAAAVLSGNRVVLGAGAGWMREEFDQLGQDFDTRGPRMEESIEVLRTLWGGGMVEHHGRFYDFPKLQMAPVPSQPVPIYIGGQSKVALRRAARLGDGWMSVNNDTDELVGLCEQLRILLKEEGREGQSFDIIAAVNEAPTADVVNRLEDVGVTKLATSAWFATRQDTSTVDGKRAALERFAEKFIR